jgi:hypothetical protein
MKSAAFFTAGFIAGVSYLLTAPEWAIRGILEMVK